MTARDEQRPTRLLAAERDALLPILRSTPEPDFDRPTACPGWSIRDVLAHAALGDAARPSGKRPGRWTSSRRISFSWRDPSRWRMPDPQIR
jgi:uncharacterized protein (TIGR03083 family)